MKMNTANLKKFREDFTKAVSALEKKYGVSIGLTNISYDNTSFHTKLNVVNVLKDQVGKDATIIKAEQDWKKWAMLKDLPVDGLGKDITIKNTKYTILGFLPSKRKMQVLAQKENETAKFCLENNVVINALKNLDK